MNTLRLIVLGLLVLGVSAGCRSDGRAAAKVATGEGELQELPWRDDVASSLNRLREGYLGVSGAMTWSVAVSGGPAAGGAPVDGAFGAWFDGPRYRYALEIDQALGLSGWREVAFDGTFFYLFDPVRSTLLREERDPKQAPLGVPNPLMLAWDFLSEDSDACNGCALRVSDLAQPAIWDARLDSMTLIDEDPARGIVRVSIPGGVLEGRRFKSWVSLVGPPGKKVPVRIQRVLDDGVVLSDITMSEPAMVEGSGVALMMPRRIVIQADGVASVAYGMTSAEVSRKGSRDASAFAIDPARADRFWDGPQRKLVTKPGAKPAAAALEVARPDQPAVDRGLVLWMQGDHAGAIAAVEAAGAWSGPPRGEDRYLAMSEAEAVAMEINELEAMKTSQLMPRATAIRELDRAIMEEIGRRCDRGERESAKRLRDGWAALAGWLSEPNRTLLFGTLGKFLTEKRIPAMDRRIAG
jgi:hypothetical protein